MPWSGFFWQSRGLRILCASVFLCADAQDLFGPKNRTKRLLARLLTIPKSKEGRGNNRSVMPLDALGRTRTTLVDSEGPAGCFFNWWGGRWWAVFFLPEAALWRLTTLLLANIHRGWDWGLELCPINKECLVSALHKDALILSLSLVHTARRLIRLVALASSSDYLE